MVIYMYIAPGWGHMSPWVHFFSESSIVIYTTHFLQDFHLKLLFKSFPHSNALATNVDLAIKEGQGHHRVMIYMYIVALEPSMLHAKFL